MALDALLLDDLLGDDIAGREEHRRGDALREQWPGRQFALVPTRGPRQSFCIARFRLPGAGRWWRREGLTNEACWAVSCALYGL